MKNFVKFIEIPAENFERAVKFYETVFNVKLTLCSCETEKMAFFGDFSNEPNIAISWTKEGFRPSKDGVLISLNVNSIDDALNLINTNGGKTVRQKTKIEADGLGYFATFLDSEGNTIGLYSDI